MTKRTVWRPAMYGSFVGAALGSLLTIYGWSSPDLALCLLQFIAIVACGFGCGLGGGLVMVCCGNLRDEELQSNLPASGGLRGFQFSLASMFVFMTVMALILSAYFSVGRLVGMTPKEVLTDGLRQSLYLLPLILVWSVGWTMAIRRLKRNRMPAILTMIAVGGLILMSFVGQVVQMVFVHMLNASQSSYDAMFWYFIGIQVFYVVVHTTCWILILAAIFCAPTARRPENQARRPQRQSNPGERA